MKYFCYKTDNIDLYQEEKTFFPTNFNKLKMGKIYFMVKLKNINTFTVDKIMITNFPNLNKPTLEIKYIYINENNINEKEQIIINHYSIPKLGQKKEIIILTTNTILCTTKQTTYKLIKHELMKHFSYNTYLDKNKWTEWQKIITLNYKNVIEQLKSI